MNHLREIKAARVLSPAVKMSFPPGPISVKEASYTDETNGRNWTMPQASDVRFLAVRGTIMIGDIPLIHLSQIPYVHRHGAMGNFLKSQGDP